MNRIRVMLCDDHAILRGGLRALLGQEEDMEVVGEASTGEEAVEKAIASSADVAVMDLTLPGIDGLEATRQILARAPECRVLVLTMRTEVDVILAASRAGALGYVLKSDVDRELVRAIRSVSRDQSFVYSADAKSLLESHVERGGRLREPDSFSRMQARVTDLIADGKSAQEIASLLHLSTSTVHTYCSRIMKKLGLGRRSELVRWAVQRQGLRA